MSPDQLAVAKEVLRRNLTRHTDWIVLNMTMNTLGKWAESDSAVMEWLRPRLEELSRDGRKSVAKGADRLLRRLYD
jgi:hypothetical protein